MNEHAPLFSSLLDSAHLQRLEQLSDADYWEYVRRLAAETPKLHGEGEMLSEEYLECVLSVGSCLVSLSALYEIVSPAHGCAFLPATPPWMLGLSAWRGEAIACIDLEAYLTDTAANPGDEKTRLIAHCAGIPLGLRVQAIGQAVTPPDEEGIAAASPPGWIASTRTRFIKGVYVGSLVLDLPPLLADVLHRIEIGASYG